MSTSRSTKSSSPSPVSNGRRSPTTSATSQHPKPKATPSTTVSSKSTTRSVQPSPSPTAAKRQPTAKKPTEKPPSPSGRPPQRTLSTPVTTRERSPKPPFRALAPKPKVIGSDKGSKPIKSGATTSYSRSKSLEKRREVVASSVEHTTPALDTEVPVIKTDIQEKEEIESPIHADDTPKNNDVESPVGVEEEEASHEVNTSPHQQQQPIEEHLEEHVVEKESVEEKEETTEIIEEGLNEHVAIEPVQETVVEKPAVVVAEKEAPVRAVAVAKEAPVRTVVIGTRKESVQNDVIEEAKSKFMEKRKNKVLALVGAFETVMALQEPEGQQSQQPQRKGKETEEGSGVSAESTVST